MKVRHLIFAFALLLVSCSKTDKAETQRLYLKALDSYTANNLDESENIIRKITARDKKFYPAFLLQGKIYFFNNEYAKAEIVFTKLIKQYPEYTEAKIWCIRTQILSGQSDKAEKALKKELTFNTTDWRIYYLYSLLAAAKGEYETQIAMLNQAEEYSGETVKIYLDQARFWHALAEEQKALSYLKKASSHAYAGRKNDLAIQNNTAQLKQESIGYEK